MAGNPVKEIHRLLLKARCHIRYPPSDKILIPTPLLGWDLLRSNLDRGFNYNAGGNRSFNPEILLDIPGVDRED